MGGYRRLWQAMRVSWLSGSKSVARILWEARGGYGRLIPGPPRPVSALSDFKSVARILWEAMGGYGSLCE